MNFTSKNVPQGFNAVIFQLQAGHSKVSDFLWKKLQCLLCEIEHCHHLRRWWSKRIITVELRMSMWYFSQISIPCTVIRSSLHPYETNSDIVNDPLPHWWERWTCLGANWIFLCLQTQTCRQYPAIASYTHRTNGSFSKKPSSSLLVPALHQRFMDMSNIDLRVYNRYTSTIFHNLEMISNHLDRELSVGIPFVPSLTSYKS